MSPQAHSPLQDLQQLRRGFTQKLSARIQRLEDSFAVLQSGAHDRKTRESLRRQAHALAGTSGTFGYFMLGNVARRLDILLKEFGPDSAHVGRLIDQIGELLTEIVRLGREPPDTEVAVPLRATVAVAHADRKLVFCLDDEASLGQEIARQLDAFGYHTEAFINAADLQRALATRTPSALLLDVDLGPEAKTGPQVAADSARLLQEAIPLLFVSVHDDWESRMAALRAGARAYITKPVDFSNLAEVLDGLTGRSEPEPLRVLVLDSDPDSAEQYALILSDAGMQALAISQPSALLRTLAEMKPDLLLMDMQLTGCSGLELAGVVRQKSCYDGLPIILITAEQPPEQGAGNDDSDSLWVGCDQFLLKPISQRNLIDAVSNRASRFRSLNALMTHDGLTGLQNQISTKLHLEELLPLAIRQHMPLSFALIDLDEFKQVNDRFGHPVGDRVLRSLARLLQRQLRRSDTIGRYGGEEFAVIMPGTSKIEAVRVMDQVRRSFEKVVHQSGDTPFALTLSAGVSSSHEHSEMGGLIVAADSALYQAKSAGRNQVCVDSDCSELAVAAP